MSRRPLRRDPQSDRRTRSRPTLESEPIAQPDQEANRRGTCRDRRAQSDHSPPAPRPNVAIPRVNMRSRRSDSSDAESPARPRTTRSAAIDRRLRHPRSARIARASRGCRDPRPARPADDRDPPSARATARSPNAQTATMRPPPRDCRGEVARLVKEQNDRCARIHHD